MEIPSPVMGVVKEILAAPGDAVSEGQELLILESMKMEIPVEAPAAGTLAELVVAEGARHRGQPLFEALTAWLPPLQPIPAGHPAAWATLALLLAAAGLARLRAGRR